MERVNVHMNRELVDAINTIATQEGRAFAEVLRELAQAGLLVRQDRQTQHSRLFALIEALEAGYKALDQRVAALEAREPPAAT